MKVRGVIARSKGAPVELVAIAVPDPGPGEALVAVQACGVCHTDLHYREGAINDDFPFLLGHEAAGIVEAVGPDVTEVEPGDFVVLNWRAICGTCRACSRGEPWYCFATHNAAQKMTLAEGDRAGTALTPALGIGAFADKTLVHSGQCTKVDPSARPAAVGLLGCGVMAGLGAALNTGNVRRGQSVAVIGCGGVGAAAVAVVAVSSVAVVAVPRVVLFAIVVSLFYVAAVRPFRFAMATSWYRGRTAAVRFSAMIVCVFRHTRGAAAVAAVVPIERARRPMPRPWP